MGEAPSTSSATLAASAVIEGANVRVHAENKNDFIVTSKSGIKGLKVANTGQAAAIVISNVGSAATTSVGGIIRATGDVWISGRSVNANNDAYWAAKMKATPYPSVGGGYAKQAASGLKTINLDTTSKPRARSAPPVR